MTRSSGAQQLDRLVRPPQETQVGIARRCGVTPQAVSKWLDGFSKPAPEHREKLAELGIPIESWDEPGAEEKGAA